MKKSIFGMLLMVEGLFMGATTLVALYFHYMLGETDWKALGLTAIITFLCGAALTIYGHTKMGRKQKTLSRSGSFIIVGLTWIVLSLFGMLPFLLYKGINIDVASAYFEAMSGFTTMGGTVFSDIDHLPHGILFWRCLTQWMGGLGIVVISFALLPISDMKNATMFQAEMSGLTVNRLQPKIGATSRRLLLIYIILTLVCAGLYWAGPMNLFDAVCHALTTISTGGFSTHTASFGHFHSRYLEYVASSFMLISSINFGLYYYISMRRARLCLRDDEVRAYLLTFVGMMAIFCLLFHFTTFDGTAAIPRTGEEVFRASFFHVATIFTSTGYQGEMCDYVAWGTPFWMPTLVMMIIGGCTVSTAGGVKMMRVLVYLKYAMREFRIHMHPHAVVSIKMNGHVVAPNNIHRVMAYLVIYVILIIISCAIFSIFMNFDLDTAFAACVSSFGNTGPALGVMGPTGNYATVPALGKMLLSFLMVVGRLEIFTVLFLFMPKAWKI